MIVPPGKTIGIIGGGQLGRMICLAAKAMGYRLAVLDPTPDCPCTGVADLLITAGYGDMDAAKKLADASDVITYEFENIDTASLGYLENRSLLPQGIAVLETSRNRRKEKNAISRMGIPVAAFKVVDGEESFDKNVFYPSVLKTAIGGYDGKGQVTIRSDGDIAAARELSRLGECVIEEPVPFSTEISVILARSVTGETSVFPVAENIHVGGILRMTVVPARVSEDAKSRAVETALKIADGLGVAGVMATEMFVVSGPGGDEILVNEIAPRPHNSGHFSMDACMTGQFEQHVRAVCGLPLGDARLLVPAVMVNILGEHIPGGDPSPFLPLLSKGKLHLYGKTEARKGRKMGHVNMLGDIDESLRVIDSTGIWRT